MGIDYRLMLRTAVARTRAAANVEITWASTREVFNMVMIEADEMGCHIITAPAEVLKMPQAVGSKNAAKLSLETVRWFRADTLAAGLILDLTSVSRASK